MEQSKLKIKQIHIFDTKKELKANLFYGQKIMKHRLHIGISRSPKEVWFSCPFCGFNDCRLIQSNHKWVETTDIDKFSVAPSIGQHGTTSCHFYIKRGFFLINIPSDDLNKIYF